MDNLYYSQLSEYIQHRAGGSLPTADVLPQLSLFTIEFVELLTTNKLPQMGLSVEGKLTIAMTYISKFYKDHYSGKSLAPDIEALVLSFLRVLWDTFLTANLPAAADPTASDTTSETDSLTTPAESCSLAAAPVKKRKWWKRAKKTISVTPTPVAVVAPPVTPSITIPVPVAPVVSTTPVILTPTPVAAPRKKVSFVKPPPATIPVVIPLPKVT